MCSVWYAAYADILPGPWILHFSIPMEKPKELFAMLLRVVAGKIDQVDLSCMSRLIAAVDTLDAFSPDLVPVSASGFASLLHVFWQYTCSHFLQF